MTDRKINADEYRTVSNCLLAMWIDAYLKDWEYDMIMDRLNVYARKCRITDKVKINMTSVYGKAALETGNKNNALRLDEAYHKETKI